MRFKERSRTLSAFNKYHSRLRWANARLEIWQAGLQWYRNGTKRLQEAINESGANVSLYRAAGVASLLSPLTPWSRNMRGAEELVRLYASRASYPYLLDVAERSTVYNTNAKRAVSYLQGNDLEAPGGMKTGPFHKNLAGNLEPVTVDSWMYRIVDRFGLSSETPTENANRSITRALKMCATLYGIAPAQAQAIVWTVERDYWSKKSDRT
jgi:hypothetical protein